MKHLWMALLLASASGCAIVGMPYQEPDSGAAANIKFKNEGTKSLEVAHYLTSKKCKGRRNIKAIGPGTELMSKVRADEDVTFQYHLTDRGTKNKTGMYCLTNLRFTPRNDAQYEFRTTSDAFQCKWIMLDVTDPGDVVGVPLQQIPWKRGWDENSSFCDE
jgi:hypothetical protein